MSDDIGPAFLLTGGVDPGGRDRDPGADAEGDRYPVRCAGSWSVCFGLGDEPSAGGIRAPSREEWARAMGLTPWRSR
jgi:hypothetical protein